MKTIIEMSHPASAFLKYTIKLLEDEYYELHEHLGGVGKICLLSSALFDSWGAHSFGCMYSIFNEKMYESLKEEQVSSVDGFLTVHKNLFLAYRNNIERVDKKLTQIYTLCYQMQWRAHEEYVNQMHGLSALYKSSDAQFHYFSQKLNNEYMRKIERIVNAYNNVLKKVTDTLLLAGQQYSIARDTLLYVGIPKSIHAVMVDWAIKNGVSEDCIRRLNDIPNNSKFTEPFRKKMLAA